MTLDLTAHIKLDKKNSIIYRILQVIFYLSTISLAVFFAIRILFPTSYFGFDFNKPLAKSNNIYDVRDYTKLLPEKGLLAANATLNFNASVFDFFSKAVVTFSLDKKSAPLQSGSIIVRKSYQAFLYLDGPIMGFKDGSLLKSEGSYYIVFNGKMHKFAKPNLVTELGYAPEAFREVAPIEINYNKKGDSITKAQYPNKTFFRVNDEYYLLQSEHLQKFISANAFLSQYDSNQAIIKDISFLSTFKPSNNLIGFADGSILSYGDTIYITSGQNILPVDSPETFLSKGYVWKDVIPVTPEEIALYTKEKNFTIASIHSNGTIFKTSESGNHYLIQDGKKRLLPSANVVASWLKKNPILVSRDSLSLTNSCSFKKDALSDNSYSCEIPIANMQNLLGSDYEFYAKSSSAIQVDTINIEFKKDVNQDNLFLTLSRMSNRVKNNYVPTN
ncbi:MAG: hypothetical protein UT50_C0001G0019 [Candidatus Moranbacteria bacterium GW2011_GWA2_39_41]|nr:MAG: hypothetical protein UT50_C0001G0019 [Candidatus Moranbacteria bacterium GW2011_GWA2_39_41]